MIRIFLKLGVAIVTFTIGVSITAVYWLYRMPDVDVDLPEAPRVYRQSCCFPGLSVRVVKSSAQNEYFSTIAFSENANSMHFLNEWYSRHLYAMNEEPLTALENEDESYRFLWLRTFHRPVVVHVWRTGERHYMVVKRLNGRGGYEPGTFDLYWARSLSEYDWDVFMMHLEHSRYWLMSTKDDRVWFDGAQWILEGYREGRYHLVDRQNPDDGPYRDAALYLLRQSGLLAETPANEVY